MCGIAVMVLLQILLGVTFFSGSTQKRGATTDTSSGKASFNSIDALGTLISQYISRMSFNFGYGYLWDQYCLLLIRI